VTHQLFLSNQHLNSHKSKHEAGGVQAFITQLQTACQIVDKAGCQVDVIGGDRGYYDGELFAAAYFGFISKDCTWSTLPRVIVPKKFTRGKEEKKIAFLEDPNSTEVSLDFIQLSPYTHPALIELCKASQLERKDSMFQIPVASVALVDEYGGKKKRSLGELKSNWAQTKQKLVSSAKRLKALQAEYIVEQKKAGIKDPKPIAKKTKRKRRFFRTQALYHAYQAIWKTMLYIESLKSSQHHMLNALMFFCISVTKNENPVNNPEKFMTYAKAYHERWGIESGFKEDKAKFLRAIRSRKSTQRQWNLTQGMMHYNRWHVIRMKEMLKLARKPAWNYRPWNPRRPYIRRKLERKYGRVLKAESYLLHVLKNGIEKVLDRILIQ
jgi:hypothetical protein